MGRLEQLWYTRAADGLERRSGFQVVAASEQFANLAGALTVTALRLCQYAGSSSQANSGRLPVSYGWIDRKGWRFVFTRVDAGLDTLGRPGNFCAHIVAGPKECLPADELALRYNSSFWWRNNVDVFDQRLPSIDLEAITPNEAYTSLAPEGLSSFLAILVSLQPPARFAIPADSDDVAAFVAATSRQAPGLLENFTVSTYETGDPTDWFDIVGIGSDTSCGSLSEWCANQASTLRPRFARVASAMVFGEPAAQGATAIALEASTTTGRLEIPDFVELCDALLDLGHHEPTVDRILPALRSAEWAAWVLRHPGAMTCIAQAMAEPALGLWNCLGQMLDALPSDVAENLSRSVAVAAWRRDEGRGVGDVLRAANSLTDSFAHRFQRDLCATIPTIPRAAAKLDATTRHTLLTVAAADRVNESAVMPLLVDSGPDFRIIARSWELPQEWRAAVLAEHLDRPDRNSPVAIAEHITIEPGIFTALGAA